VLVADDNQDAAESLALLLQAQGHAVVTAADGVQAVEAARTFQPDLAFVDLGMPRMDGLEAARRMRTLPHGEHLTMVALTGWGQPEDRRRTALAGFDLHLVKPLMATDLEQALRLHR
jgi:CheY-like chemotaxis protein